MEKINTFIIQNNFFRFCESEPLCTRSHAGLYYYIVSRVSQLNKRTIGLPTVHTAKVLSYGNYRTYKKELDELSQWGLISIQNGGKGISKIVTLSIFNFEHTSTNNSMCNNDTSMCNNEYTNENDSMCNNEHTVCAKMPIGMCNNEHIITNTTSLTKNNIYSNYEKPYYPVKPTFEKWYSQNYKNTEFENYDSLPAEQKKLIDKIYTVFTKKYELPVLTEKQIQDWKQYRIESNFNPKDYENGLAYIKQAAIENIENNGVIGAPELLINFQIMAESESEPKKTTIIDNCQDELYYLLNTYPEAYCHINS